MKLKLNRLSAHYLLIVFCFFALLNTNVFSQINAGGEPMSSLIQLNNDYSTVTMPAFDVQKLHEEDAALSNVPDMPARYGFNFDVNFNLNNSGTWTELKDGSRIWRLGIKSEGAYSINLFFSKFYMPKGSFLFIYNPDKSMKIGALTELNNSDAGELATAPTSGNLTIIEYYEPEYSAGLGRLELSKVVHAYKDILGYNSTFEEPCNININCPIGAPWVEPKRSITRITFVQGAGSYLCTGSLINNVLNNRVPYYLTAEHCSPDNHNSMVFYFNYENATCIGTGGSTSQTMSGATLKSSNFDTDFRLVQLNTAVPGAFNAYYNGWDRSNAQPTSEIAIHHPGGANKKISIDEHPALTVTGFGGRLVNGFWLVVWDQGMTEGGSSGCPLFDQNKRVIGQNLGGTPANCSAPQSVQKYFGKFSESWAHGGSSSNQLKDWLDPNNTGVMTVDGLDDVTGIPPVSNFTSNVQNLPIGGGSVSFYDLTTNYPTSWSWSFPGGTPSTSTERNPTGISYTSTGAYTVSLTTSNANGTNLKTIVNYITVAGVPLSPFTLQSPPTNSTVHVAQGDPSLVDFRWGTANPSPSVNYKFKIRRVGTNVDFPYISNNNGLDSGISIRKSFLDSLAVTLGTTGDSVLCIWRATGYNGLDSITSNQFVVTIRRNTVGINQISSAVPESFKLFNNYPNPFNPTTKIKFDIVKTQNVTLKVFDMLGKEVALLVNQNLSPGSYSVDFNASGISSGMYFYRLETEGYSDTKRMVLMK